MSVVDFGMQILKSLSTLGCFGHEESRGERLSQASHDVTETQGPGTSSGHSTEGLAAIASSGMVLRAHSPSASSPR